jgi:hypothetical protein
MATNMVIDLTEDKVIDLTNDNKDHGPPTQHQYRHLFQSGGLATKNSSQGQNFNNNLYSTIYSHSTSQALPHPFALPQPQLLPQAALYRVGEHHKPLSTDPDNVENPATRFSTNDEQPKTKAAIGIDVRAAKINLVFQDGRPFSFLDLVGRRRFVVYDGKSGELDRFWTQSLKPAELFAVENALNQAAPIDKTSAAGQDHDRQRAGEAARGGTSGDQDFDGESSSSSSAKIRRVPPHAQSGALPGYKRALGTKTSAEIVYEEMQNIQVHLEDERPVAYTNVDGVTHPVIYDDKGDFDKAWVFSTLKPAERLAVGKALQAARAAVLRRRYEGLPKKIQQVPSEYSRYQTQRKQQPADFTDEDNNKISAQLHDFHPSLHNGPGPRKESRQRRSTGFSSEDNNRVIAESHAFYSNYFDRPGTQAVQEQTSPSSDWTSESQQGRTQAVFANPTYSQPAYAEHTLLEPTFAERIMAKMGHQQGKGLGRNASGIVEPIAPVQLQRKFGIGASSNTKKQNVTSYTRAQQPFLRLSENQTYQEQVITEKPDPQEDIHQQSSQSDQRDQAHHSWQHTNQPEVFEIRQAAGPFAARTQMQVGQSMANESTTFGRQRQPLPDQRVALGAFVQQPHICEEEDVVEVQPCTENLAHFHPSRLHQLGSSAPEDQGFPGARSDSTPTDHIDLDDVEFISERRLAHNERGVAMKDLQRNNAIIIEDDADMEMTQVVVYTRDSGSATRSRRVPKTANSGQTSPSRRGKNRAERRPANKPRDENRVQKRRTPPREEIRVKKEKKLKTSDDVSNESYMACQLRLNKHLASFSSTITDAEAWARAIELERTRLARMQERSEKKAELNGTPKCLRGVVKRTAAFLDSIEDPTGPAAIAAQAASESFVAANTKKNILIARGEQIAKKTRSTKAVIQNLRTNLRNLCATFGVESEQYRNFKVMVEETITELENSLATGFTDDDPLAALTSALTLEGGPADNQNGDQGTFVRNDNDANDFDSDNEGGVGLFGQGALGLVEDAAAVQARANRAEQLQQLQLMHSGTTHVRAEREDELQQLRALLGEIKLENE